MQYQHHRSSSSGYNISFIRKIQPQSNIFRYSKLSFCWRCVARLYGQHLVLIDCLIHSFVLNSCCEDKSLFFTSLVLFCCSVKGPSCRGSRTPTSLHRQKNPHVKAQSRCDTLTMILTLLKCIPHRKRFLL